MGSGPCNGQLEDFKLSSRDFREGVRRTGLKASVFEVQSLYMSLDLKKKGVLTFKDFYRLFDEEPVVQRSERPTGRLSPEVVKLP